MQSIDALTRDDFLQQDQQMAFRFEVYDGEAWQDLSEVVPLDNEVLADGGLEAWSDATDPTDWTRRKKVTIKTDHLDANQSGFPLYVPLNDDADIGAHARADGYDLRFTLSDGITEIPYERVSFSISGGLATAELWVKCDLATSGTYIYLYYGKSDAADGSNPTGVWDDDFKAVYHMNDATTSTIDDSTANGNDGTKKGANEPVEAAGVIGKGQDFDGEDDYIGCGNDDSISFSKTDPFTVSAFIKSDGVDSGVENSMLNKGGLYGGWIFELLGNNKILLGLINSLGTQYRRNPTVTDLSGNWHLVIGRYDGSANRSGISIYLDGEFVAAGSSLAIDDDIVCANDLEMSGYKKFNGVIDEARVSSTARSSEWIKFEYHNMAEADNELEWGEEEELYGWTGGEGGAPFGDPYGGGGGGSASDWGDGNDGLVTDGATAITNGGPGGDGGTTGDGLTPATGPGGGGGGAGSSSVDQSGGIGKAGQVKVFYSKMRIFGSTMTYQ